MHKRLLTCRLAMTLAFVGAVTPARAQWAVVDTPAIVQLIQQVQTLKQQLQTARDQLTQSQQALQTMIGNRGMDSLLAGIQRNYLPTSWLQLTRILNDTGGGSYGALAADVRQAMVANAVLTPQQLSMLSASGQQRVAAARQSVALRQALSQEALATTSARFATLQSLVTAIGSAQDQKAILDLQARISAELGMLQNEQTKLQVLRDAAGAQDAIARQQAEEQAIAGHGWFQTRFQPTP